MIDQNKRKNLKTIGLSALGTTFTVMSPGAFAAAQNLMDPSSTEELSTGSGVTIKHYENSLGHTVLLRNDTNRAVTIREVSPSRVSTPCGEFDLAVLFKSNKLSIPANSTQAVSVTYAGKVNHHALWSHNVGRKELTKMDKAATNYRSISVIGQYHSLNKISVPRAHTATMLLS